MPPTPPRASTPRPATPRGTYWDDEMCRFYYSEIKKPGSLENAVDNFWNNTLGDYFTKQKKYGIEQEQRPLSGNKQRADFTVRYVKNGVPKKVVLLEDKRRGYETQPSKWVDAVDQLTTYLKLVRMEQAKGTLYGAVTIGTYVRFYYLPSDSNTLVDFAMGGGQAFELQNNDREIHAILNEFVRLTSH
ncbi:hypothetical protein FQN57_002761 [Myotisia sp. PD_48]|nr:hypothetical protein FQN57_002761 [Myotisia sp. PD_48]